MDSENFDLKMELGRLKPLLEQEIAEVEELLEADDVYDLRIETYTLIPVFSYRDQEGTRSELIGGISEGRKPREKLGTLLSALLVDMASYVKGMES